MIWIHQFWAAKGDTVLVGIMIAVGAAGAIWMLSRIWRVVAIMLGAILRFIYWSLIGWWASKVRRWATGSTW
jgi:hypothetical protein